MKTLVVFGIILLFCDIVNWSYVYACNSEIIECSFNMYDVGSIVDGVFDIESI